MATQYHVSTGGLLHNVYDTVGDAIARARQAVAEGDDPDRVNIKQITDIPWQRVEVLDQ